MPPRDEIEAADALGGNRLYEELRGYQWEDVRIFLELEDEVLPLAKESYNEQHCRDKFLFEKYRDSFDPSVLPNVSDDDAVEPFIFRNAGGCDWFPISFLDLGMASIVGAVSALKCIPVTSCNAGMAVPHEKFQHAQELPLVAFYANFRKCDLMNAAALHVGTTFEMSRDLEVASGSWTAP